MDTQLGFCGTATPAAARSASSHLPWGALIGKDITDSSLKHRLAFARANGVTQTEMAELLTYISLKAV